MSLASQSSYFQYYLETNLNTGHDMFVWNFVNILHLTSIFVYIELLKTVSFILYNSNTC